MARQAILLGLLEVMIDMSKPSGSSEKNGADAAFSLMSEP
jgi:hypothetical protein